MNIAATALASVLSEEVKDLRALNAEMLEALGALAAPKDADGNRKRIALAKAWGLKVPATHSDLTVVIARAALTKATGGKS